MLQFNRLFIYIIYFIYLCAAAAARLCTAGAERQARQRQQSSQRLKHNKNSSNFAVKSETRDHSSERSLQDQLGTFYDHVQWITGL